ncbi:jg12482 [Pararge aegeria aegeria]|uniref:Jg12482 protein n=1 Tax=Pararge aegeria aegeria TaxID=348720 RepID=A0A8S4S591_9NEOP|nr:jg12482 [Pararge aegeria aegeria]
MADMIYKCKTIVDEQRNTLQAMQAIRPTKYRLLSIHIHEHVITPESSPFKPEHNDAAWQQKEAWSFQFLREQSRWNDKITDEDSAKNNA